MKTIKWIDIQRFKLVRQLSQVAFVNLDAIFDCHLNSKRDLEKKLRQSHFTWTQTWFRLTLQIGGKEISNLALFRLI